MTTSSCTPETGPWFFRIPGSLGGFGWPGVANRPPGGLPCLPACFPAGFPFRTCTPFSKDGPKPSSSRFFFCRTFSPASGTGWRMRFCGKRGSTPGPGPDLFRKNKFPPFTQSSAGSAARRCRRLGKIGRIRPGTGFSFTAGRTGVHAPAAGENLCDSPWGAEPPAGARPAGSRHFRAVPPGPNLESCSAPDHPGASSLLCKTTRSRPPFPKRAQPNYPPGYRWLGWQRGHFCWG